MSNKIKYILCLIVTLTIIYFIKHTLIIIPLLLILWYLVFKPFTTEDIFVFLIAVIYIIPQNYIGLKSGIMFFKNQDFLLMPYYEPLMWGFYYIFLKRFINEPQNDLKLSYKILFTLFLTASLFSYFFSYPSYLFATSIILVFILLLLFHEKYDLYYMAITLFLGFIIELFGVQTELWYYPKVNLLKIPYWFSAMWICVGLFCRRLVIPLAKYLSNFMELVHK